MAAIRAELLVGEVPRVVAGAADAGVRDHDRPPRHRQRRRRSSAAEACARSSTIPRASIRRIISRPAPGQAALLDAVGRAAERVVEEVARRHHPEAGVGDDLDVGRVVVERVRAFDREEARRDRRLVGAPRDVGVEVGARADQREPTIGAARHGVRPVGLVQRPREKAPPGRRRPAPGERQQDDVVAAVVVALDVEVAGRLRARGEDLERDVALDEAGHVDVALPGPLQQVAAPQQRVGVEVGHEQPAVQRAGPLRCVVRRRLDGQAEASLGPPRRGPDRPPGPR